MTVALLQLLAGLVALGLGAEGLVRGAAAIALRMGISALVVGLTVVAFGTSCPELLVCIKGALNGQPGLAVGNAVGSNIFNIGSIMGITALIKPMSVGERIMQLDMWIMLACALLIAILAHWKVKIGKRVGVAMTVFYSLYVITAFAT